MSFYSITDKGKQRLKNEDNYSNYLDDRISVFSVADGMGGYKSGEIASEIAVFEVKDYVSKNVDNYSNKIDILLEDSIREANNKIYNAALNDIDKSNMGSTIVVAAIKERICYISYVGDSRMYLYRDGEFKQMTKDHSYVQNLVDTGIITAEQAKNSSQKNYITNALGVDIELEISSFNFELKKDDIILLATDGLTSMVEDEEMKDVISLDIGLKEMSEILVYMANSMGGYDNITLTIVKCEELI